MRARTHQQVADYGGPLDPLATKFTASTVPHPDSSAANAARPGKDGFARLFNGKNLAGWTGDSKYWSVEDGAITGRADGSLKLNRFITWKGSTIRNFELRVKVKVTPGGNSGIQYRGRPRPDMALDYVSGYQCDIVADIPSFKGMAYEERGRRILAHTGEKVIVDPHGQPWIVGDFPIQEFEPNKWHDYRVLVRGNHLQHWINDHPTAEVLDFDADGRSMEGVLGFQVHQGPPMKIQIKDILIKHLPDNVPLEEFEDHPIPRGSKSVRPQGKLPPDWQPKVYGE